MHCTFKNYISFKLFRQIHKKTIDGMNSGDKDIPMASWPEGRGSGAVQEQDLPQRLKEWREEMPLYGCSQHRASRACMVPVVAALILLTYVTFVILNRNHSAGSIVLILIFHIFLALLVASYVQIVAMNPGEVPMFWHDVISESAPNSHALCRKCNRYKPPRSHYDSVTQRLVLNMDHFCPWVANTVGFYNRKFFVLFTIYTTITSFFVVICFVTIYRDQVFPFFVSSEEEVEVGTVSPVGTLAPGSEGGSGGGGDGDGQSTAEKILFRAVFVINCLFGLMLFFFSFCHINMALSNETTIENSSVTQKYDLGKRANWEQVCQYFGRKNKKVPR